MWMKMTSKTFDTKSLTKSEGDCAVFQGHHRKYAHGKFCGLGKNAAI